MKVEKMPIAVSIAFQDEMLHRFVEVHTDDLIGNLSKILDDCLNYYSSMEKNSHNFVEYSSPFGYRCSASSAERQQNHKGEK